MRRPWPLLATILLLGIGCVRYDRGQSFVWWTHYYEVRMGLQQETVIRLEKTPASACGEVIQEQWLGADGPYLRLVTYYDPEKRFCRPPWDVALHECCHRRMQHPQIGKKLLERLGIDPEVEAKACEEWYR